MEDKEDVISRMFKSTLHHITNQIVHRFVQIQDKSKIILYVLKLTIAYVSTNNMSRRETKVEVGGLGCKEKRFKLSSLVLKLPTLCWANT